MAKATRHLQLQTTLQDRFMNLREAAWAVNITEGTITFTHEGPTGGGAGADRRHASKQSGRPLGRPDFIPRCRQTQTEKEEPQPQVLVAFGLRMAK